MSRKVKSIRYTHYSAVSLKKLLSAQQISQKGQPTIRNKDIESIVEDILEATHQSIRKRDQILQSLYAIYLHLEQNTEEYFFQKDYSTYGQNLRCEDEPLPNIAPQAQIHKKHSDLSSRKHTMRRNSKDNIHYPQFQDCRKIIDKCKRERDLKKSCSNGNFIALSEPLYRASQENTEQIQQLMRRKKELFLEVANTRTNCKSKVMSTQRKEKKPFFHNDFGEATQMSFQKQIHKANTLVPVNIKVHVGRSIASNLKKKGIVEFAINKKSRRQIERNGQDACNLIEEIKENDFCMWSEIHRVHTGLKSMRIKDEQQDPASAFKLPTAR